LLSLPNTSSDVNLRRSNFEQSSKILGNMAKKLGLSSKAVLSYRSLNKDRRKKFHIRQKQARDKLKRDDRFKRRREEEKDPQQREERRAKNKPQTLDSKRTWDDTIGEDGDNMLGVSVDLEQLYKKRRLQETQAPAAIEEEAPAEVLDQDGLEEAGNEDDVDSMLDFDSEADEDDEDGEDTEPQLQGIELPNRATSPTASTTSTRLDLTPEALSAKFPTLFEPPREPKILVTTSIESKLHDEARLVATLFPNSQYVRRTANRFGHKYSIRVGFDFGNDVPSID
jgi:ribosome production factor 1